MLYARTLSCFHPVSPPSYEQYSQEWQVYQIIQCPFEEKQDSFYWYLAEPDQLCFLGQRFKMIGRTVQRLTWFGTVPKLLQSNLFLLIKNLTIYLQVCQVISKDMHWKTKTLHQCNKICSLKKKQNWPQHGPLQHAKIRLRSMAWSTISNAALRSNMPKSVICPLSIAVEC